ncbi:heparan-alpha-glucosaminide N-acetyltransferase domain-containing protein [Nonlabens sp.]|uniref:heparan-alpha-glucosaminide N-acetyltransferase domain-containing protein n=1 Tax=Nonlabens sp. TaxID=1888209 RepID=UPI0025F456A4|nr:heparan-alpha-glucosaminide N-acetyltransferase domain-containing protein [Nonlabens sp.]
MKTDRLFFIDAVRAFAIVMMMQGHFVDTLLAPEYRDMGSSIFQVWSYFRGITAPTFFTISGIVFTYLLMKSKKKGLAPERIRKGLMRGLLLIAIGYGLRVPIWDWLTGTFNNSFLIVDVLHCIGLSIIITVGIYYLTFKKSLIFSILMLVLGISIFIMEPWYRDLDTSGIPLVFANYLTQSKGSVFTIIPWLGYMSIGAFIASLFYRYFGREKFKPIIVSAFIIVGTVLIYNSSYLLMKLYYWSDILLFKQVAYYNYLFIRLGNVLILLGIFFALERFLKNQLIFKIGQKTLSIYIIHFVLIYGSLTGFGLSILLSKSLNPYQATIGAVFFVIIVCLISLYGIKTNAFIYKKLRGFFKRS